LPLALYSLTIAICLNTGDSAVLRPSQALLQRQAQGALAIAFLGCELMIAYS
jgi:hypothetical protein